MKSHPFNWIATAIFVLVTGIWLFMNFGLIHSKHLEEAVITDKIHEEDSYYVKIDDQKLRVKDTNTWMMIKAGETYNVTYEWYASEQPYVTSVNQAHDDDQIGGGH